jgi:Flp pilus assembly pilin Flp
MYRDPSARADRRSDERGQTMVEYAVVLSVITVAIMATIMAIGDGAGAIIDQIADVVGA